MKLETAEAHLQFQFIPEDGTIKVHSLTINDSKMPRFIIAGTIENMYDDD
jgi:hypothetical protein